MTQLPFHPEMLATAHLRIARPTDRLLEVQTFYCDVLGFKVLGSFADHAGFDGVMLGHPSSGYHLEFTAQRGHQAGNAPSPEHLLVFYIPDAAQWQATVAHIESKGIMQLAANNPYWNQQGRTYEDPDGYRFVIQNAAWPR